MVTRHFTLEQANAALQTIRPLMDEILAIRAEILTARPGLWPAMERAAGNGGSPELGRLTAVFDRLDALAHEVLSTGAEIKDLSVGLMDFRAWRQQREVYLCWKHGEPDILFWHELDAGFSGRQPIEFF